MLGCSCRRVQRIYFVCRGSTQVGMNTRVGKIAAMLTTETKTKCGSARIRLEDRRNAGQSALCLGRGKVFSRVFKAWVRNQYALEYIFSLWMKCLKHFVNLSFRFFYNQPVPCCPLCCLLVVKRVGKPTLSRRSSRGSLMVAVASSSICRWRPAVWCAPFCAGVRVQPGVFP